MLKTKLTSLLSIVPMQITTKYTKIAVFGAGLSGQSVRALGIGLGAEVCVFDEGGKGDASDFNEQLLESFDAFVFSPGFAKEHPWRSLVERSHKPCYSELGFAASHWRGKLIGITGTNGKTSLTSLLYKALKSNGICAFEAGNIGIPLSDLILSDTNTKDAFVVCEISSFQAELPKGLKLDGLIWTNFAEDHLNRYATMHDYFSAKSNLLQYRRPGAPAFLGDSVPDFNSSVLNEPDVFIIDGEKNLERVYQLSPESIFRENPQAFNFSLADALWRSLGFPVQKLLDSANVFKAIPHRLNRVVEWGDVVFWNDSKATNFHAALAAINSIKKGIYWIAGGSYKGGDLQSFVNAAAPKVERTFLYGAVAKEMADYFRKTGMPFEVHEVFEQAVTAATQAALVNAPSAVLLSPGFASFDQFSGYGERGDTFTTTILKLKDKGLP